MDALDVFHADQIFTHTCPAGVQRSFNTSAIMRDIAKGILVPDAYSVQIPLGVAEHCEKHHGVEETQLARVDAERLKIPILIACFDDGSQLIIDGSHRVVAAHRMGIHELPGFVLPEGLWKSYIVTGWGVVRTLEEAVSIPQAMMDFIAKAIANRNNPLLRRAILIILLVLFALIMLLSVLVCWVLIGGLVFLVTPYYASKRAIEYTWEIIQKTKVLW